MLCTKTQHRDLGVHEITSGEGPGQALAVLEPEPNNVVSKTLHCFLRNVLWPKPPYVPIGTM